MHFARQQSTQRSRPKVKAGYSSQHLFAAVSLEVNVKRCSLYKYVRSDLRFATFVSVIVWRSFQSPHSKFDGCIQSASLHRYSMQVSLDACA
eukprot:6189325-Pleurochrysis_carterae.AAC.1